MDTPEKTHITSLSKFEDSPVFSYINSLSPIKPVKSIHIQTFQSLSLSSLPSIFTSPQVISHKESRFLRRHSNSDLSKSDASLFDGNKVSSDVGNVAGGDRLYDSSGELDGNFDSRVSVEEASVEHSGEHLKFVVDVPENLKYDFASPDCASRPRCGMQTDNVVESDPVEDGYQRISNEDEVHLESMYQIEQNEEVTECNWENLISDAADMFIFNSPTETDAFKGLIHSSINEPHDQVQTFDTAGPGEERDMEDPSTQPGEAIEPDTNNQNKNMSRNLIAEAGNDRRTLIACQAVVNLNRGMRRRCLDFEMVGACKNSVDDTSTSSSMSAQSEGNIYRDSKQLVPLKPGSDSSKRVLPGIGLHLNALAATSRDNNKVKQEILSSRISSSASLHSPITDQEPDESLPLVSVERNVDPCENNILLEKDAELNLNSPKKKRRKLEGDGESCKRCNCKKSKCLKLYCECFAAGVYCIEPCSCQDCFNKPIHEDTVLATRKQIESRNPLAFAPKVIRNAETVPEVGEDSSKTPASARHKRGCNCKKSSCLKKYCECYQGGVGCSATCRCEGCKNAFGRKDGSAPPETELEPDEGAEASEIAVLDKAAEKSEIQINEEQNQNPNSVLPMTPLQLCRSLVSLPFSSKSKPPRSFLSIGSSSALRSGQKYGRPSIIRSHSKLEKQFHTGLDEDIPEILRGSFTPSNGMMTGSPNSKRVSPPSSNLIGSSPGLRSSRKLILQSIPSFPSLTPQH